LLVFDNGRSPFDKSVRAKFEVHALGGGRGPARRPPGSPCNQRYQPWERAPEREPSRERMSTWKGSDTGGDGPTRDRPTQRAPTQRAPDTQGATHARGATHTGDTQTGITISRSCFERCCRNRKAFPYHYNVKFATARPVAGDDWWCSITTSPPFMARQIGARIMNEARLSHLPFWGPSEGFFFIN